MDTTTLLIIVVVVVVVALIISRNRSATGGAPYTRTGPTGTDRPTYDDPDYTSAGSIGGSEVVTPVPQERSVGGTSGPAERTHDDPNYRSGGSIGGG